MTSRAPDPDDGPRAWPAAGRPFDTSVPHIARVYDYWLGGKDHFAADREAAEYALAAYPGIRASARANRAFLARVVGYLAAERGVRQFLDIGTGLPTANNTHEVAQGAAAEARIVYVDNDPMVLAHARALLTGTAEGATAYLDADLRDPEAILRGAAATLDLTRPVAVMLLAVLHYIPDLGQALAVAGRLMDAVPAGSFLAISHAGSDIAVAEMAEFARRLNEQLAGTVHEARPRGQVEKFFAGLDLVEPGVVRVTEWRPRSAAEAAAHTTLWGGAGRKP